MAPSGWSGLGHEETYAQPREHDTQPPAADHEFTMRSPRYSGRSGIGVC